MIFLYEYVYKWYSYMCVYNYNTNININIVLLYVYVYYYNTNIVLLYAYVYYYNTDINIVLLYGIAGCGWLDVWGWLWDGPRKKLKAVFKARGGPFYDFGGKIAVFGLILGWFMANLFLILIWMWNFLYFYIFKNIFLCTYTGKWSKIAIFGQKKGIPSEDVASNAIWHTTPTSQCTFTERINCSSVCLNVYNVLKNFLC